MKDKVVFTFGRFNPPTIGHEKLLDKVYAVASKEGADFLVFPSHSQNPKKDPLDFRSKVKFMKKMFPKYSKNIMSNNKVKTAFNAVSLIHELGYKQAIMVVGGDRVSEFDNVLNKYNGVEGRHGFYEFEGGVKIVSAGERDPDAEGVSGMSASKMRAAAAANDYDSFKNGLPSKFRGGELLFKMLRKAMKVEDTELGLFLGSDVHTFREFVDSPTVESIEVFDDKELMQEFYTPVELQKRESSISGFKSFLKEEKLDELVSQKQIDDLEKFADKLLKKYQIDVEFTRHFVDRINDKRNTPEIKVAELQKIFKKIKNNKGNQIKSNADDQAIIKDISSYLNIPVVIKKDKDGEIELTAKTIMRKKNFSSSNAVLKYEELDHNQIDEIFDNFPWMSRAAEKVFKKSRYKEALKYFLQVYEKDPKHSAHNAFRHASQTFNLRPRRFKDFLDELIGKGLLPPKYSF